MNMAKIMVVDDDEEFTTLYQKYLTMAGFEAIAENHSSMAMEVANSAQPDLFVLDLMMPEPDGFKLCRMLREDPIFKRTPIIIITALDNTDSRVVAIGAGANGFLRKPFHVSDLTEKVKDFLR